MNRIDRLFASLLKLQAKTQLRAENLARHFEVSKRIGLGQDPARRGGSGPAARRGWHDGVPEQSARFHQLDESSLNMLHLDQVRTYP
jgi:hypothetical protein